MLGTVPMVKRCEARRGHAGVALAPHPTPDADFWPDGATISESGSHHCHIEILK
jgi:hypothetical protein